MPNTIRRRTTHAQVKAFWAEHDAGKRVSFVRNLNKVDWNNYRKKFPARRGRKKPWFVQSGIRRRQPEWFDRHTLVTVRRYSDPEKLRAELRLISQLRKAVQYMKLERCHFQFIPILGVDRKGLRIIEEVKMVPCVLDFRFSRSWNGLKRLSLYGGPFAQRMQEKGVEFKQIKRAIEEGYWELDLGLYWQGPKLDASPNNLLVLDYDPKTKKPTLAFVDYRYSLQE